MGRDVKIGLALGLVVIVVVIVVFSVKGSREETPSPDGPSVAQTPPAGPGGTDTTGGGQHPGPGPGYAGPLPPGGSDPVDLGPTGPVDDGAPDRADTADRTDPPAPPASPPAEAVTHVVVAGDSLWRLAKRYYGRPTELTRIFEANRNQLRTPDAPLRIGMELVIPDAQTRRTPDTADPSSGGDPAGAPAEPEYDQYVVRPGDTLTLIALRIYGDESMTAAIRRANPRLARNPDRLAVGWTLRVPKAPVAGRTSRRDID